MDISPKNILDRQQLIVKDKSLVEAVISSSIKEVKSKFPDKVRFIKELGES